MSFHQYQGPKRFQLHTSDDEDDDIPVFVSAPVPYLFTTTILLQQLQHPASASFSFHKLKHRFRSKLDLYSTSLDALHCNAVRECQVDRQTDRQDT